MATVLDSGTKTATAGGTEDTLATETGSEVYVLMVDINALASGEHVELAVKAKVLTGGTVREVWRRTYGYAHGQSEPIVYSPPLPSTFGATFTLTQLDGTGRAFPWQVLSL